MKRPVEAWKYNIIAFVVAVCLAVTFGISYSQSDPEQLEATMTPNEVMLSQFPSDGTAYNEIHRYYASCQTFGDVAAACYDGGYATITKVQMSDKISKKYWVLSQGQVDVCNMMFNKGIYDQYMGKDMEDPAELGKQLGTMCYDALNNIDAKSFEKTYGTQGK